VSGSILTIGESGTGGLAFEGRFLPHFGHWTRAQNQLKLTGRNDRVNDLV